MMITSQQQCLCVLEQFRSMRGIFYCKFNEVDPLPRMANIKNQLNAFCTCVAHEMSIENETKLVLISSIADVLKCRMYLLLSL